MMLHTLWGIVKENKIELLEEANIPEGAKVLVTLITQVWRKYLPNPTNTDLFPPTRACVVAIV